jgi:hypothetical protein
MNSGKYAGKQKERKSCVAGIALGLVWLVFGGSLGCGYTLSHRLKGPFLSPNGIFIPVFENQTDEVGAERVFTDALIRELQSRGQVTLSTREQGALELRGVLRTLTYTPTAYTVPRYQGLQAFERMPSEIGVTALISLSLIDPKSHQILWSGDFTDFRRVQAPTNRTYNFESPSSVALLTQSTIEARYIDLAHDIVRDVYDDMVELF